MASVWDESEVRGRGRGPPPGAGLRARGAGRAEGDAAVVLPQDGVGEEVLKMSTEEIVQRTRLLDSEIKVAAEGRRPPAATGRGAGPGRAVSSACVEAALGSPALAGARGGAGLGQSWGGNEK